MIEAMKGALLHNEECGIFAGMICGGGFAFVLTVVVSHEGISILFLMERVLF